jgi:hypothetical protein
MLVLGTPTFSLCSCFPLHHKPKGKTKSRRILLLAPRFTVGTRLTSFHAASSPMNLFEQEVSHSREDGRQPVSHWPTRAEHQLTPSHPTIRDLRCFSPSQPLQPSRNVHTWQPPSRRKAQDEQNNVERLARQTDLETQQDIAFGWDHTQHQRDPWGEEPRTILGGNNRTHHPDTPIISL